MIIFNVLESLLIVGILVPCLVVPIYSKDLTARISPKNSVLYWNDYGIFKCYVTGDPAPRVTWYNNVRDITHNERTKIHKISGGYMIRFGKLHPRLHNGTISCKASNGVDQPVTDQATLRVLTKKFNPLDPSLPAGFPKIMARYNPHIYVTVGTSITLVANVTGNPTPKITWFRDGYIIDLSNPRLTPLANNSLRIANAQVVDKGKYDYMAENNKGRIFSTTWSVVTYIPKTKPVIAKGLKDQFVDPQTDVKLNCTATGYPEPIVTWKYSTVNHVVGQGNILVIRKILYTETYTCIAQNDMGIENVAVKITVSEVPFAPVNVVAKTKTGSTLTVIWQEGNTSRTVDSHIVRYRKKGDIYWNSIPVGGQLTSWTIDNLDTFSDYEVQIFSKNSLGTSQGSDMVTLQTDETAPGSSPRNIVVKATGPQSFEASWDPPEYPNGVLLPYIVYYTDKPKDEYDKWRTDISQKSPHEIQFGLKRNHRYAVVISARTALGAGPVSKIYLVQTLKGAPSEPQNMQTKVISPTSIQVSWSKPIFNGGGQGVIGYEVHYNVSSDTLNRKAIVDSPDGYSITITGLTPYTTYRFAVAAKTDAGTGPITLDKMVKTKEDVPSAAPVNLSCVAVDAFTVSCMWSPPPFESRNGKIIGYKMRYKILSQGYSSEDVAGSVLSFSLRYLQAYTKYYIDIAAKTSLGVGPFSKQSTPTTKETKPTKAPENFKAKAIGSTQIEMTWQAPTPPFGAKLKGYIIYYRQIPKYSVYKTLKIWGDKTKFELKGLEPEKDYELRVAVFSEKGSKLSDVLVVKTKQSKPLPPILRTRKLPAPQLGADVSWTSQARDIQAFRLRYAKEVEKIVNVTHLQELPYVEMNFSRSVTFYNFTNFEPGLWYVIKISVRNAGGWSEERKAWLDMDAAKPSGAPLSLRVEPASSTSLQLSWGLPSKWKRNGKIIGYKVSYHRVGTIGNVTEKVLDSKKTLRLSGLSTFSTYKIWIRARTVAGDGPAAKIKGTTKEGAPSDPPTVIEAKGMGTDVVLLRFKPPLIPNGKIVGYKAIIYLDNPNTGAGFWKDDEETDETTGEWYIGNLIPKHNPHYWFKVAAKTSAGYGPFSPVVLVQTLTYDLPLPVRKLSTGVASSNAVKLTWNAPVSTAAIRTYQVTYRGEKTYRAPNNKLKTIIVKKTKKFGCCAAILEDLEPHMKYVVTVLSVGVSHVSEMKEINVTTKIASSPSFNKPNYTKSAITEDYLPIYLSRASERNGPISYYLVYVASLGATLTEASDKLREISERATRDSRPRREAKSDDTEDVYITAKLNANEVPVNFKVGKGDDVNGYKNKPLTVGNFYAFEVKSCVVDENLVCLATTTGFTDPVAFTTESTSAVVSKASTDPLGGKLWLVGPVAAILVLLIVIVVVCLLWRRRVRLRKRKPAHLNKLTHEEHVPIMPSPGDPVEMQRMNLETEGMREHPPIHISQLGFHIEDLQARNNDLFTREYESIDPGMTFISEASARHLNQSKNRYPNIVPYDHTRVVLQETSGFLDSDYINANFMAGYRKQSAYIATQAPLRNTINDFWLMVWEQDARTIIMMTNLQEKGRIKCDQYWPNQVSEKFGNVSVTVVETVELAHYTVRTFRLCKDGHSDQSREIKQFQYTAWPDHGVPHYSTSLLCFIRKVRLSNPPEAGPMVVHCSAGVGRTGVFIVIDSMLERIRREQTVDVYGHVTLLRSQRNNMVQTEDQYIFIHQTLLEAVLFGNTEIQASDLSQYYKKLNEIGENETTNIEEHFKQLSVINHPHRFVTAVLPVNKIKNRFDKILPYEQSRVDLVPVRGIDGSNYINASFIDGYKQRRAYIAAQGPLEDTVNDFWRMIMEKKSTIIVMLSGTSENDQDMSAVYWPIEKSAKYHFYIVDPVSVEETPNFTLRQFKVNDMMRSGPSLIKLFQLRKWSDRGKPQSYKGILDLIGQVHTARNNDDTKGPVVVHCGSGSGRTGVFCALSIVVERMRAEGVVDLLQTVRQLREQRPEMVETLEEYSFCYETALQYLSSFDHIA